MEPLINILIRTHRPEQFKRCMQSVQDSGYQNTVLHVINGAGKGKDYEYNLLCNDLKQRVGDGWFFYLDDDDTLIPGALSKVSEYLDHPDQPVVCQMLRNGRPKPGRIYMDTRTVKRGHIGMPCLLLHAKHKDLFEFPAVVNADYLWIKTISEKLNCRFIKIPLVDAGMRSHGK